MTFDLPLTQPAGSGWLHRLVRRFLFHWLLAMECHRVTSESNRCHIAEGERDGTWGTSR
jgi:hypothetical protein